MACIKLDILDKEYRKSELKESSDKKELTFNFCDRNAGRSLFNAKEYDEESKLYYWEARYQDPNMGIFISPDPLFEKKPWMSKYAFCRNNPLRFIDPDGRDEYEFDKKGKLVNVIENKNADILRVVKTDIKGNIKYDKNGDKKVVATSNTYEAGTITGRSSTGSGSDKKTSELYLKDNNSRESMFGFLADNTKVEWGTINATQSDGSEVNMLGTSHSSEQEGWGTPSMRGIIQQGGVINEYTHSHPNTVFGYSNLPSGYGFLGEKIPESKGDKGVAETFWNNGKTRIGVYDARDKIHYNLTPSGYQKR